MTRKQILKKLNSLANDNLEKNYEKIMSLACDYNGDNYDDESAQIWVADVDNGIAIEEDYYFFN